MPSSTTTGQTSYRGISAPSLADVDVFVGLRFGARRPAEGDLERMEAEDRALEPDGRKRDPDLVEQLLPVESDHLGGLPALDQLREHRGRGLADGAAAAL